MGELSGKVALVTGAARGIGQAVTTLFVREGAAVMVADLPDSNGAATAAALCLGGGQAAFVAADVTRDAEAMVAATVARFGRLDVGVYIQQGAEDEMGQLIFYRILEESE